MSKAYEVVQIHTNPAVLGSAILEDPRLDYLINRVAGQWRTENEHLMEQRKGDSTRTAVISSQYAAMHLGYAAELHCKRALKSLRAGKEMPIKTTPTQNTDGLRNEDLPELNRRILEVIGQLIINLAEAMGQSAVMSSDPDKVSELISL